MKHSLHTFAAFTLAAVAMTGCRQQDSVVAVAPRMRPPCAAALTPIDSHTDQIDAIARMQNEAQRAGRDKHALERLGYLYVERARVSNDARDYARAEAAADCLTLRYPEEPAALLLRGHVLHQLHRFPEAETVARALISKRTFVLDYGLLGDVLMEQGRVAEAADAYQRMSDLKPFYQSYVRAAHVRWLKGNLSGATELMQLAIRTASPRHPELSAWALTRLAMYELQAGRLSDAADAAERALAHQPEYTAALLARGRIFLAMGRTSDALDPLRRAVRLKPLPEYQWALADALRLEGLHSEADGVEQELIARGAGTDPRTLGLYLATRRIEPARALELAEEELRERADVFTLDAHAWALAANGRMAEAREVMTRALAEGTEDGRLFLHAGVIDAAAGRAREARRWFSRAERLKAMLLPSEAAHLERYTRAN
jgi:tetratricopeptide (TPR) repeat protein